LRRETGTVRNIKDKGTRKKVSKALTRGIRRIQNMEIPSNGFILFTAWDGVEVVVPDRPVTHNSYACGKRFDTEKYHEYMLPVEKIGLADISVGKTTLLVMEGDFVSDKMVIQSGISGDHNQGGQSQGRFRRKRQQAIKQYLKRVDTERKRIASKYPGIS